MTMPHLIARNFRLGTLIALTFALARTADAQKVGSGRLEGTVRDSVHTRTIVGVKDSVRPGLLAGVKVLALDTGSPDDGPRTTISDSLGRFHFDSLPAGGYMVGFESPLLDSLEIQLPPRRAEVVEGGVATVSLALPSAAKIRAAVCPGTFLSKGTGALFGHVVRAETEGSLANVRLTMTWRDLDVDPSTLRPFNRVRRASVTTDAGGWYVACGVPTGSWLVIQLEHEGRVSVPIRLVIGDTLGVAISHLSFSAASARPAPDSVAAVAASGSDEPLSGQSALSGVIRGTGGAPVAGADVRVWGTAVAGRTDQSGHYALSALPAGTQMLEVRQIGYGVAERSVELRDGAMATGDVQLRRIVTLDSMRVVAMRTRYPDFERHRKEAPFGIFLGPLEVARQHVAMTSDIVAKLPGFLVVGYGFDAVVTSGSNTKCKTNVVVNGMENQLINDVHPADIGAIESYPSGRVLPIDVISPGCGAILIWTKR